MTRGLFTHIFLIGSLAGPLWAQTEVETALANEDTQGLMKALGSGAESIADDKAAIARLLLLEELALTPVDDTARRQAIGEALRALDPEDPVARVLLQSNAQEKTAKATQLPDGFDAALADNDGRALIDLILADGFSKETLGERISEVEEAVIGHVRPLPAREATANKRGYEALARLDPENANYASKAKQYAAAEIQQRSALLRTLKKKTDSFNDVTFYHHPSEPRYADTRTYFLPYIVRKDGRVWMRFQAHYTSDSWLFVQRLLFNIDGNIRRFPTATWKRDNDSEIWEWADVLVDNNLKDLMLEIANSNKTVARFEGRQYYKNVTVRASDKQAIKDMFEAENLLKEMPASE